MRYAQLSPPTRLDHKMDLTGMVASLASTRQHTVLSGGEQGLGVLWVALLNALSFPALEP
jgi:hypothetical protein